MKEEKYYCDIKDCKRQAEHLHIDIQVIFTTEQTEGRSVNPYLSMQKMDICGMHLDTIIQSGNYVCADGAQGYNNYYIKPKQTN